MPVGACRPGQTDTPFHTCSSMRRRSMYSCASIRSVALRWAHPAGYGQPSLLSMKEAKDHSSDRNRHPYRSNALHKGFLPTVELSHNGSGGSID